MSQNTALEGLWCYNNQLTILDVSYNIALQGLNCDNNRLTALDVSHNTALEVLKCGNNQLTTLDVSHNKALQGLNCDNNRLTTLNVSQNAALMELYCQNNHLPILDLSSNEELTDIEMVQTIPNQTLASANGKYQYDLSQLVPLGSMAKVTVTGDGQLDKATGKVTFANKVDSFTYQYATGRGDMDVTVNFTEEDDSITPPTITAHPKDVSVTNGENATFTVKATGEGVAYQWYSRPNANANWTLVDGATKDSYTVTGTKDKNGWQFRCQAKNGGGEVYSNAATLTVTEAALPTIKTQPKDAKVKIGAKAKFKVKASGKNVTYQWYYRTSETGEWVLIDGATKATYEVVAMEGNIGWQFRCLAKNADGQVYSKPATLRQK